MVDRRDIEKLASLSRIAVSPDEYEALARDIEAVLSYVSEIQHAAVHGKRAEKPEIRNVMREDGEPDESGRYTEKLLQNAPAVLRGYLRVKKIIAQD